MLTQGLPVPQRHVTPVVSVKLVKGMVNAVVFQKFIADGVGERPKVDGLDNARIHHMTKACVENGILTIKEMAELVSSPSNYLPAFMPILNPIEHCFKIIKNDNIKPARPRTEQELVVAIWKGLEALMLEKVNRIFKHCFVRARLSFVAVK